jgi:hypothetical protein
MRRSPEVDDCDARLLPASLLGLVAPVVVLVEVMVLKCGVSVDILIRSVHDLGLQQRTRKKM